MRKANILMTTFLVWYKIFCVISEFCRDLNTVFFLLGCYAAFIVIYLNFGTTYLFHLEDQA
jgi:hypothetical protein